MTKLTDLTAYTTVIDTDPLYIVDITNDISKKFVRGDLFGQNLLTTSSVVFNDLTLSSLTTTRVLFMVGNLISDNSNFTYTVASNTLNTVNQYITTGLKIGASYSGDTAPANGAIIQGQVGVGTNAPTSTCLTESKSANAFNLLLSGTSIIDSVGDGSGDSAALYITSTFTPTTSSALSAAINLGVDFSFDTATTCQNAAGIKINNFYTNHLGTIALGTGIYIGAGNAIGGAGTITNNYGLYCQTPTAGTNKYCAYFEGNVGIGTTSPTAGLLQINSTSGYTLALIAASDPSLTFYQSGGTADNRRWKFLAANENFYFTAINDGDTVGATFLEINRTGTTINTVALPVGNIVIGSGALATTATDGFLYVTTCAGVPTGTATAYTGRSPLVYDTTNDTVYFYNGTWNPVAGKGSVAGTSNQITATPSTGVTTLSLTNGISIGSYQATASPTGGIICPGFMGIATNEPLCELAIGAGSFTSSTYKVQINAASDTAYFAANRASSTAGALFGWSTSHGGVTIKSVNSADQITFVMNNTIEAMAIFPTTYYVAIGSVTPLTQLHLKQTQTITGNYTDFNVAAITLQPLVISTTGVHSITSCNYFVLNSLVDSSGGTDAVVVSQTPVFYFDLAPGSHTALLSGTTKTTPGTVDA